MHATKDIIEGETILAVKGVAAVLEDTLMSSHCSGCFVDISGNGQNQVESREEGVEKNVGGESGGEAERLTNINL